MSESAPSSSSEELQPITLDLDPGRFRFSRWRNISITVWSAQATLAAAERVLRLSRQLNLDFPEGRSQVMIVYSRTPAPEGAASELLTEIYDPRLSRIVCIAAVLEGSGFWASGIRSRMTSMRMAVGGAQTMRAHETIEEVVSWLPGEHKQRTGVRVSAAELKAVLTTARRLGTAAAE
jgi:hypothetical protein